MASSKRSFVGMRALLVGAVVVVGVANACDCADTPAKGKPKGADCATAADCDGNLVCHPDTSTCDDITGCKTHAECGAGAFCDDLTGGTCVDNAPGGLCDVDANCVN